MSNRHFRSQRVPEPQLRARSLLAALALTATLVASAPLEASNGSNYVHLINGVDTIFQGPPLNGQHGGAFRCFPADMLHAPTLVLTGPEAGTYATKIKSIHLNVTGSPGSVLHFPTISLSSSKGKCNYLDSTGTSPNFGTQFVSGVGTVVVGPLTGNAGPEPVNVLAAIGNVSLTNPAATPYQVVSVCLNLISTFGHTIDVPVDESLVLWAQDDPNQFGPGTRQYWTASVDERNLCSGYSFLLSGNSTFYYFSNNVEWGIGFGTVDATLTTAIRSLGPGSVHDSSYGFSPGFDAGSGTRTISITGAGSTEFLAFNIYDENGPSPRLAGVNCAGFNTAGPGCSKRVSSFFKFPTGGPGGPVLNTSMPEMPRSVGKIDTCTTAAWSSPIWMASTNHVTAPGANNVPYVTTPALNGGSNAGGNVGGFVLPIATWTGLPGMELFFWSLNLDPANAFLDSGAANGHKLTNGYPVLFFP